MKWSFQPAYTKLPRIGKSSLIFEGLNHKLRIHHGYKCTIRACSGIFNNNL
ncbi:hypothetical protein BJX76DRAFT_325820, partial [Aspergillus varians]